MSSPTSVPWRFLRSAAFAAVATSLAALGHLMGGGAAPDLAVLLVGGVTIGAMTSGLARRRRRWAGIFGVLAAAQLAFHLLFVVDGHAMAGGRSLIPADPAGMLTFHLLAAAAAAFVLAYGEWALFSLFSALRRCTRLLTPAAGVELPPGWTVVGRDSFAPRPGGALLSTSPRRGPPALK